MRTTHLLFTVFIYLLLIRLNIIDFSILGLGIILIATLLPDIDAETSKLGRKIKLISKSFKHRGFFHSLLFGMLITGLFYYANTGLYLEFAIGYSSHILLDLFNYKTVQLFWPFKIKTRGFIKTNGLIEKILRLVFLVADVCLVLFLLF